MQEPKSIELRLSKSQQRTVLALVRERQQIVDEGNRQVLEINTAIDELATLYGQALPSGRLVFEQQPGGAIVLVSRPVEEEAAPGEEPPAVNAAPGPPKRAARSHKRAHPVASETG
jgi:hypothetical protein